MFAYISRRWSQSIRPWISDSKLIAFLDRILHSLLMTTNFISPQWANRPVYCKALLILGLGNIISYLIHVPVFHGSGLLTVLQCILDDSFLNKSIIEIRSTFTYTQIQNSNIKFDAWILYKNTDLTHVAILYCFTLFFFLLGKLKQISIWSLSSSYHYVLSTTICLFIYLFSFMVEIMPLVAHIQRRNFQGFLAC